MAAPGSLTTGANFLQAGQVDGNLRRVNTSSEETAVDLDEDTQVATDDEKTSEVEKSVYLPRIIDLDDPTRALIRQAAAHHDFYRPAVFMAQAIDTGTLICMMTYLVKLLAIIPSATSAGQSWVYPSLFVTAKLCNYSNQILDHVWRFASFITRKRNSSRRLRLCLDQVQDQLVPRVDIIITTYSEDVENVIDTVEAAAAIDYPQARFRVFVSDDGKDPLLEATVLRLQKRYPNLFYNARDKKNRPHGQASHGSKAGNVNDCIYHAIHFGGEPAKYFICLDADMIPSREIARALVAHAESNENVGMVTLPQSFYNLPTNDPIHQDMSPHSDGDEVMRDRLGAAWCPGSGFLINAKALSALKGFPETSIAEDVLFSWVMQGKGYETIYVNEKLQCGLQPNSLASHIGQRTKWCVGHINNSCELRFCCRQPRTAGMNKIQWVAAFLYCLKPWTSILKFASWILLACLLYAGQPFIAAMTQKDMRSILHYHLVFWFINRINEVILSRPYGYWNLRRQTDFNIWISPYLTRAIFWELLPNKYGGHNLGFTATGSMRAAVDERNGATRGAFWHRLVAMNRDTGFMTHVAFFFGMVYLVCHNLSRAKDSVALLSTALFPGLGFEQLPAFLAQLLYAMNPPTDAPRRSLMRQDAYGIWAPESRSARCTLDQMGCASRAAASCCHSLGSCFHLLASVTQVGSYEVVAHQTAPRHAYSFDLPRYAKCPSRPRPQLFISISTAVHQAPPAQNGTSI